MAKPILVLNWKNHHNSLEEAKTLLREMSGKKSIYKKLSLFIAPPLPYFESVSAKFPLASQDISVPEILKSFGVRLAIIGHSDRRAMGETAEEVSKKIKIALRSGIIPLVCIGEKVRDTDGEHFEFLRGELKELLGSLFKREAEKLLIAYEPVWAIGKSAKDSINPDELSETLLYMRKVLSDLFGRKIAEKIPILYGGSVEPLNAGALSPKVRGFIVGHASLKAKNIEAITKAITK